MPNNSTSPPFLPYGRQSISDDDIAAVTAVLRGDWLTTGPAVEMFEDGFAKSAGADYAVACANGTAALHLAMLALEVGPNDLVVVPAITFLATANAARYVGAEVVFADVDPDNALMTPSTLQSALDRAGRSARVVMPVHIAGQIADIDTMEAIASEAGALLVEDACHALGGKDRAGRPVGNCEASAAATFSFHPVKTIAAGEGGIVTTNDSELAKRLRLLRNHGMVRDGFSSRERAFTEAGTANPWYYEMSEPGYNYRLTDIQAALAHSQLKRLGTFVRRRQELVSLYDEALAPMAPLVRPASRVPGEPGWHLYTVLIEFDKIGLDRAALMTDLREKGIGTQVHYIPVHLQPYYSRRYGKLDLPGAIDWYRRTLSVPLFPSMSNSDVHRVAEALIEIVTQAINH